MLKLYKSDSGEVSRTPPSGIDFWTFKIEPAPDKPIEVVKRFMGEIYTDLSNVNDAIENLRELLAQQGVGSHQDGTLFYFIYVCLPPRDKKTTVDNPEALKVLYKVHPFDIGSTDQKERVAEIREEMARRGLPVHARVSYAPPKLPNVITCLGRNTV